MKAVTIENYGDVEQLQIKDVNVPAVGVDQVLIKIHAAGVNPVDCLIRSGMFKDSGMHALPLTLGWDAAGTIEKKGVNVSSIDLGDEVYAMAPLDANGSYAEYLVVNANLVAKKPNNLSFVESAAIPLAATSALQALFKDGMLQAGQRVLIHNTSGGVGSFAVQLAKAAGAYVIGTGSEKNRQFIESLGVDEFIDYHDFGKTISDHQKLPPVDLVFAAIGGDNILEKSLPFIKEGGYLISALDELDPAQIENSGINYKRLWVQPNGEDLIHIKELVESGKVKVHLDSVFPLAEVKRAHLKSETGRTVGKIVIKVID